MERRWQRIILHGSACGLSRPALSAGALHLTATCVLCTSNCGTSARSKAHYDVTWLLKSHELLPIPTSRLRTHGIFSAPCDVTKMRRCIRSDAGVGCDDSQSFDSELRSLSDQGNSKFVSESLKFFKSIKWLLPVDDFSLWPCGTSVSKHALLTEKHARGHLPVLIN